MPALQGDTGIAFPNTAKGGTNKAFLGETLLENLLHHEIIQSEGQFSLSVRKANVVSILTFSVPGAQERIDVQMSVE